LAGLLARLKRPTPRLDQSKLACGIIRLLNHAIHQHRNLFYGERPKRIELHPALGPELYAKLGPLLVFEFDNGGERKLIYDSIEIVFIEAADMPRMITCRNEVEYL
jgi:hypothetical protein